jgi:glutathione-regulated potassium-efflux system ancillary protein KefF
MPPYEQTAALAGMRFLDPLVLHGAHRTPPAELQAHVEMFLQRLASYPDWPEIAQLEPTQSCDVPASARPES